MISAVSSDAVFLAGVDGSLARVTTGDGNSGTFLNDIFLKISCRKYVQLIFILVNIYGMGSWLTNHGSLCYHNDKLAAYIECIMHGIKRRGKGIVQYKVLKDPTCVQG